MRNKSLLCIDLGSAYTKLGVRTSWDGESQLLGEDPARGEASFCIPSVAVSVERHQRRSWVFGDAAADLLPADGVTIYRNWKASLFPAERLSNGSTDRSGHFARELPGIPIAVAKDIALGFFRHIKKEISNYPHFEQGIPVRVCIPHFQDSAEVSSTLAELIAASGFVPAGERPTLFEPESNAIGLLSRGTNSTWFPNAYVAANRPGRCMFMPKMISDSGLLRALHDMEGSYTVLVVDVGAFTTDFGLVVFDATFKDDNLNRPRIEQQSVQLGVRDLDMGVFRKMTEPVQAAIKRLPSSGWDREKRKLYRDEEIRLVKAGGGILTVGEKERPVIQAEVREFGASLSAHLSDFLQHYSPGGVNAYALTGGGTTIPFIRSVLKKQLGSKDLTRHVATDPQISSLVRGGSAVGGTSVFFE